MKGKFMKSKFLARVGGVQAISLVNEDTDVIVFGPFCQHCGTPQEFHSLKGNCPRQVGPLFPPPCCSCHGVRVAS